MLTVSSQHNRFLADTTLQRLLRQYLSPAALQWALPVLTEMGEASASNLDDLAALANQHPPVLIPRDRQGNRVDRIEFHPAYRELMRASYGQGIIGHYYDSAVRAVLGSGREVVKFAHGYLFSQAEQGLYCPICMTDGAAYLIERYGSDDQKRRMLGHLTARDLGQLWEGAMFLTEKAGGSDVGAVETRSQPQADGSHALYGEKWFCSNAGAEMAMVLARPQGAPAGTTGLGLFALRRHRADGSLNGLHLERLKDKLGTRSMPTAEIILEGAVAEPLGDLSRGFVQMTDMLNLSRIYNATASLAIVRRVLTDSVRWCQSRQTFGNRLLDYPMVQATLGDLLVELEAALHLLFSLLHRRGKLLVGEANEHDERLLRMLTPLVKYTTAKLAVWAASEALELHGGNGYIEDWPLARFFRDAQVLPIWEGATNILVLDTMRAIRKSQTDSAFFEEVTAAPDASLRAAAEALHHDLAKVLSDHSGLSARVWCDRATRIYQAKLLLQAASDERSQRLAENYLLRHFSPRDSLVPPHQQHAVQHFHILAEAE